MRMRQWKAMLGILALTDIQFYASGGMANIYMALLCASHYCKQFTSIKSFKINLNMILMGSPGMELMQESVSIEILKAGKINWI